MNLYDYHDKPKTLHKHQEAHDTNLELIRLSLMRGNTVTDEQLQSIARDPEFALEYARKFLYDRRFRVGEKAIASNPLTAYQYATNIFDNARWPQGEEAIASSPITAFNYAKYIIKGKWPDGENIISTDPFILKNYNNFLTQKGYTADELIQAT